MKKIVITEQQMHILESVGEMQKNNSLDIFFDEIKLFLAKLMGDNTQEFSEYWTLNGLKKNELILYLKRYGVIEFHNDKMLIPKKNFTRKISRLYYELFPEAPGFIITEKT